MPPFDPTNDPNNRTDAVFGAVVPATLALLREDPTYGDGNYTGPAFTAWLYVIVGDGTQAFYNATDDAWVEGAAPPLSPYSGAVIADLATLRALLSAMGTQDDGNLDRALSAAKDWVYDRVSHCEWDQPDVQYAILLLAARLYQRRKTPEGTGGFAQEGVVTRFVAEDPDIARLLTRRLDMRRAGIG